MKRQGEPAVRTIEGLPVLMTTAEVAEMLKVNNSTVCRWRQTGTGPRVTWLSRNMPRYQRDHVIAWLERAAS